MSSATCVMCGFPTITEHGVRLCSWCHAGPICASCGNHCEPTRANSIVVPKPIDNTKAFLGGYTDPSRPLETMRVPKPLPKG